MIDNKPVSIFGATGFIGSAFYRQSANKCIAVDRESREPLSDDVLYLTSTTHNYHVFDDVHRDIDTNLSVLVDVLEAWRRREPKGVFNFVSSWFIYGKTVMPAREDGPCFPRGFYSVTKYAAEGLVRSYCETFGLQWRILRLCGVYGPGDKPTKQKNALQWLVGEMAAGRDIELYHGGHFLRHYLHVDDAVRAIDLCMEKSVPNRVLNVGSPKPYQFRDLIDMAARHLDYRDRFRSVKPSAFHRAVQVRDFTMDTERLQRLGFVPLVPIDEGIRELCQIMKNQPV